MNLAAQVKEAKTLYGEMMAKNDAYVTVNDEFSPVYQGESIFPHTFRPYQKAIINDVMTGRCIKHFMHFPRRSGKDVMCWSIMLLKAFTTKGLYAYITPQNKTGKRIIWKGGFNNNGTVYKFLDLIPKPLIKSINSQEMTVELINGSIIYVIGSEYYDRLRGIYLSGVVFSEFAFGKGEGFDVISPVMSQSKGFILINTTPNGVNFSWAKFALLKLSYDWNCTLETCETLRDDKGQRYITNEMIEDSVRNGMSEGSIRQEFYCEPWLDENLLYYAVEIKRLLASDRVREHTIHPHHKMHFALDLGISDATAVIGFQVDAEKTPLISYFYQNENERWLHYIEAIKAYCVAHDAAIGTVFLPHDAAKRDGATLSTAAKEFKKHGLTVKILKRVSYKDGLIDLAKGFINKLVINKSCELLITALSGYSREYNEKTEEYQDKPRHDKLSHANDAFQYMSQAISEGIVTQSRQVYYSETL